jgi:hypothetical protein
MHFTKDGLVEPAPPSRCVIGSDRTSRDQLLSFRVERAQGAEQVRSTAARNSP